MGLGTRFRAPYFRRNTCSYGLSRYSALKLALGIEFRGRAKGIREGAIWPLRGPAKDDDRAGLKTPPGKHIEARNHNDYVLR